MLVRAESGCAAAESLPRLPELLKRCLEKWKRRWRGVGARQDQGSTAALAVARAPLLIAPQQCLGSVRFSVAESPSRSHERPVVGFRTSVSLEVTALR